MYSIARTRKKALSLFTKVTCAKNGGKKSKSDRLQWHKDTFSQAHDSADSKLKVKDFSFCTCALHHEKKIEIKLCGLLGNRKPPYFAS